MNLSDIKESKVEGSMDEDTAGVEPRISLESSVLGIISWWLGRHFRAEVLVLVSRHYLPEEVFKANHMLAEACKLQEQTRH